MYIHYVLCVCMRVCVHMTSVLCMFLLHAWVAFLLLGSELTWVAMYVCAYVRTYVHVYAGLCKQSACHEVVVQKPTLDPHLLPRCRRLQLCWAHFHLR